MRTLSRRWRCQPGQQVQAGCLSLQGEMRLQKEPRPLVEHDEVALRSWGTGLGCQIRIDQIENQEELGPVLSCNRFGCWHPTLEPGLVSWLLCFSSGSLLMHVAQVIGPLPTTRVKDLNGSRPLAGLSYCNHLRSDPENGRSLCSTLPPSL